MAMKKTVALVLVAVMVVAAMGEVHATFLQRAHEAAATSGDRPTAVARNSTGHEEKFWGSCTMCMAYLEAGYVAGCDVGGFVSKICGPWAKECDMAFKIMCGICKHTDCHGKGVDRSSCEQLHMC
mmetsp:Transcript_12901/g.45149  ORF Transcript_12901/g.45149 Transcript_12901/m.45149 type:complete len:125 (-) Transcript_12901:727-1101(-)